MPTHKPTPAPFKYWRKNFELEPLCSRQKAKYGVQAKGTIHSCKWFGDARRPSMAFLMAILRLPGRLSYACLVVSDPSAALLLVSRAGLTLCLLWSTGAAS